MNDLISRKAVLKLIRESADDFSKLVYGMVDPYDLAFKVGHLPSAQPEDYAELKREFIRMAEYIDLFLVCDTGQKETLIGFITRIAEHMPWTERD